MDGIDSVHRPRRQRPKDSFQNELQAKLHQRKSLGLTAEVTDSDDDGLGSLHNSDYRSKYAGRPGSAKYRSDKSPDLSRGLGTTTMRARDLTQLLNNSGGHSDDDDEEVMAATLGKSKSGGSWQPPSYKTPSPKQDSKLMRRTPTSVSPKEHSQLDSLYGRKTPSRESPIEHSKLDSIFGRKTPSGESPKEQSRLDSIYGRKTPTKDNPKDSSRLESLYGRSNPNRESPKDMGKYDGYDRKTPTKDRTSPGLSKEDIIFGRKTPTDGRQLRGKEKEDKPWQPPNFRTMSPSSSPDHSRGSRGVTPTDALLDSINETPREKVMPRLQRGERVRNDDSPGRQVSFGERPKPQARSKFGDRKTPPVLESSHRSESPIMKRTTPTMDLFGKTRSHAAQEVEDIFESDRKKQGQRADRKTPDSSRMLQKDKKDGVKRSGSTERSPSRGRNGNNKDDRKTPTGQKGDVSRSKSPYSKTLNDDENRRKQQNQNSLLDFLTGGNEMNKKVQEEKRDRRFRTADDDLDDMFAAHRKQGERRLYGDERNSPSLMNNKKPSLLDSGTTLEERKRIIKEREEREAAMREREERRDGEGKFEESSKKVRPKSSKSDETSSVCEEIASDPHAKLAKAEEKAKKSGKQTTERTRADNIIDAIAGAQTMTYIEPAKKVRPVTAEAKVQHRPKPRYGTLPGSNTQSLNERQFNSTSDIRDAIYEEWYSNRMKEAKKKKREDEQKQRQEEEKKRKEKEEKLQEAQLSYKAWEEQKKETFDKEQTKKKRIEERKKEKEREEKEEKKEASKKIFDHWKQEKDARIKEEQRKKREKEDDERRAKEEEAQKIKREKETAFRGWKYRKERELREQQKNYRDEKRMSKMKVEQEEEEKRRKEEENFDKYNEWMDHKERSKKKDKRRTQVYIDEERPAWSPASRTIPFGR